MLTAGTKVQGGYYLNRDKLDLIAIGGNDGVLPGDAGQRYYRLPPWAVLLLAPVAGGLFAMAMPLIGVFVVIRHLGRRLFSTRRNRSSTTSEPAREGNETREEKR